MEQAENREDCPEIRHLVILGHDEEPTQHVQELLLQERTAGLDRRVAVAAGCGASGRNHR